MAVRIGKERPTLERVELPGKVVCQCRPCTTPIWEAALSYARRTVATLIAGGEIMEDLGIDTELLPDLTDPDAQEGFRRLLFVQALARFAIKSWTGVEKFAGKDETGAEIWEPAPVSPAAIAELMNLHSMSDEFIARYGRKTLSRFTEGNGSRPSPNGTSAAGRHTARGAGRRKRHAPQAGRA